MSIDTPDNRSGMEGDPKIQAVHRWIEDSTPGASFDLDTDLFESELVTSLRFVELVLLLEELSGSEILVDQQNVDDFRTLRSISDKFLP